MFEESALEEKNRLYSNNHRIVRPSWKEARIVSGFIRKHNRLEDHNMLERTPNDIRSSSFWVAKTCGKLSGCIGIVDWAEDGIEIVSHFVHEKFRGMGVGAELLIHALHEARHLAPNSIFTFTTEYSFYSAFGFKIRKSSDFPRKITEVCAHCPKGQNGPGAYPCREIAMEFNDAL